MFVVVYDSAPGKAVTPCGGTRNIAWVQADATHRGAKAANMAVYDHNYPDGGPDGSFNVACARFSTLDVFHSDLQQMEIGWQVVPNNDQTCPIDVQHPQLPVFVALKTYGTLTQQQTCLSPTLL